MVRKCLNCGASLEGKNPRAIYCSNKCKSADWSKKHPEREKAKARRYRIKSGLSKHLYEEGMINTCVECGTKFSPKSRFHPFQKYCSDSCRSKLAQRNYRKKHPDRVKKSMEKYRNKYPERVKESMRKYDRSEKRKKQRKSESHITWRKKYLLKWREKNPTKTAEYSENYRKKDPERAKRVMLKYKKSLKGKFANRKRSHMQRALRKGTINHNKLIPIFKSVNKTCPVCHTKVDKISDLEQGHVFSLSKYPEIFDKVDNIHPICLKCNRRMRDNTWIDYCNRKGLPIPERVLKNYKKLLKRIMKKKKESQIKLKYYNQK